jgi:hypothetical protein
MLDRAIPLKEVGDEVHGTPFQEVFARQAVVTAPVRGREGDVAKGAGVEALSAEKSFGGRGRLVDWDPVIGRLTESARGNEQGEQTESEENQRRHAQARGKGPVFLRRSRLRHNNNGGFLGRLRPPEVSWYFEV